MPKMTNGMAERLSPAFLQRRRERYLHAYNGGGVRLAINGGVLPSPLAGSGERGLALPLAVADLSGAAYYPVGDSVASLSRAKDDVVLLWLADSIYICPYCYQALQ
ncbi:hypothetical protein McanMca71_002983 [Microsporum canis]|uniref:Uncharacterized protein n=1 Tax=Arthroderma otae (strain ATCC MYA-4605 / CBS 113480) TaxID=554155 RepID=C5G0F7_ARTOC|nr:uncharacterized protein MCYG_08429 [Microsporum canis CBS 113480]EEQ35610.1 predicted protein [Microsporum canis CBS 113480]